MDKKKKAQVKKRTLKTAPITAFLATSLKAISDQPAALAQLQAVLKATARVAQDE